MKQMRDIVRVCLGVSARRLAVALSASSPRADYRAVGFPLQSLTRKMPLHRLSTLFSLVFVVLSTSSHACQCFTEHETVRLSDIDAYNCIFIGRVISFENQTFSIVVTDRFKGLLPDTVHYQPTTSCSLHLPHDEPLREWLIYTGSVDDDGVIDVHLCSGSHSLMQEPKRELLDQLGIDESIQVQRSYDTQQTELDLLRTWRTQAVYAAQMSEMAEELGSLKDASRSADRPLRWLTALVIATSVLYLFLGWRLIRSSSNR